METKPLAYSIAEAITASRSSRNSVYRAINAGELVARKRGSRTVILAADLESWLSNLPVIEPKPAA